MKDTECLDIHSGKEPGIDIKDYLDEHGNYKYGGGEEYYNDRNYLILKKFYLNNMKPTKDDYHFLENHYNIYSYVKKNYDYSFIDSPSIRHLLLNKPLPETDTNDPYFVLLDYPKRIKIYKLIELLEKTENWNLKYAIIDRINELHTENYIVTRWETGKLIILNLLRKKEL